MLARAPGYTAVALASLSVAFALNFWFFGFIHQILVRPVTGDDQDKRVVSVYASDAQRENYTQPFTWSEFQRLASAEIEGLESLSAHTFTITGIGEGRRLARGFAVLATASYFDVLGVQPEQGRFFNEEESSLDATEFVVVVSHLWWTRQGSPDDILGTRILVGGVPCEIIGVAPEGFAGLSATFGPDVWVPISLFSHIRVEGPQPDATHRDLNSPMVRRLLALARFDTRIDPEVATSRFQAALDSGNEPALHVEAARLPRMSVSTSAPNEEGLDAFAVVVFGLGAVVFAAACINLANLSLARATSRLREFAIRRSLGAGRMRLFVQLLIEGGVLVLTAAVIGFWLSSFAADQMQTTLGKLTPAGISVTPFQPSGIEGLAFGAGLVLLATLSISLLPGLRLGGQRMGQLSRSGDDTARVWHEGTFLRGSLVVAQIACAVVLLTAAMRLHKSASLSAAVPAGFETNRRYAIEVDLGIKSRPDEKLHLESRAILDSVRAAQGVESAALANLVPLSNITYISDVRLPEEDAEAASKEAAGQAAIRYEVSSAYFETLGIPLLEGRDFLPEETFQEGQASVAIINKALAERLFSDTKVVGRSVQVGQPDTEGIRQKVTIIGVVGNTRHDGISSRSPRQLYLPFSSLTVAPLFTHVRVSDTREARGTEAPVINDLIRAIQNAVPGAPIVTSAPLSAIVGRDIGAFGLRTGARLATLLAVLALSLTLVGVYGVKAYAVQRRTRELGIRMALGATPRSVLLLLLKQTLAQLATGIAIGVTLATLSQKPLSHILLEASGSPVGDIALAAVLTAAAAALATWLPVRRALGIQPAQVLRSE